MRREVSLVEVTQSGSGGVHRLEELVVAHAGPFGLDGFDGVFSSEFGIIDGLGPIFGSDGLHIGEELGVLGNAQIIGGDGAVELDVLGGFHGVAHDELSRTGQDGFAHCLGSDTLGSDGVLVGAQESHFLSIVELRLVLFVSSQANRDTVLVFEFFAFNAELQHFPAVLDHPVKELHSGFGMSAGSGDAHEQVALALLIVAVLAYRGQSNDLGFRFVCHEGLPDAAGQVADTAADDAQLAGSKLSVDVTVVLTQVFLIAPAVVVDLLKELEGLKTGIADVGADELSILDDPVAVVAAVHVLDEGLALKTETPAIGVVFAVAIGIILGERADDFLELVEVGGHFKAQVLQPVGADVAHMVDDAGLGAGVDDSVFAAVVQAPCLNRLGGQFTVVRSVLVDQIAKLKDEALGGPLLNVFGLELHDDVRAGSGSEPEVVVGVGIPASARYILHAHGGVFVDPAGRPVVLIGALVGGNIAAVENDDGHDGFFFRYGNTHGQDHRQHKKHREKLFHCCSSLYYFNAASRNEYGLTFDCADHDAFGKILLQEGIEAHDGKGRYHDSHRLDTLAGYGLHGIRRVGQLQLFRSGRGVDEVPQHLLQHLFGRRCDVEDHIEVGIPVSHCVKQGDSGDGRQGQRQNDTPQDTKVIGSVDICGFLKTGRNAGEECLHDDHIVGGNRAGQPDRPVCVHKAQTLDEHEVRDKSGAEQHGKRDQEEKYIASGQTRLGKRIRSANGNDHVDGGSDHGQDHRILHGVEYLRALNNLLVGIGGKLHRPNRNTVRDDRVFAGKRSGDDIEQWEQHRKYHDGHEYIVDAVEDFCFFAFDHFSAPPLPDTFAGHTVGNGIGAQKQDTGDYALKQTHCRSQRILRLGNALTVNIGREHVGNAAHDLVFEYQHAFHADVHHGAHSQDEQDDDGGTDTRQGDVPNLLGLVRTVDDGGFILFHVDAGDGGQIDDSAPADFLPDVDYDVDRSPPCFTCKEVNALVRAGNSFVDGVDGTGRGRKKTGYDAAQHDPGEEMRDIHDRLRDALVGHGVHFIEHQRKNDRSGKSEYQVQYVQRQRVAEHSEKYGRGKQTFEEIESHPWAFHNADRRVEILEAHLYAVKRHILEQDIVGEHRNEQQVQIPVAPQPFAQRHLMRFDYPRL